MAVWQNLIIQLGISALVVFAGFKIAMVLIEKWSTGDAARTKVVQDGFTAITARHDEVLRTMNEHQTAETKVLVELAGKINGIGIQIATALELTPVHGIPKAEIDPATVHDEDPTPTEIPHPRVVGAGGPRQPRPASSPGEWGPMRPKKA